MKVTTGVDIIEVDRIQDAIEKIGEPFITRIYTKSEIEYCNKHSKMKYQHYAARFAVKEAVFKALSNYLDKTNETVWKNIEVLNEPSGKPKINIEKLKNENIDLEKMQNIDISISHIKEYAIANVVVLLDD